MVRPHQFLLYGATGFTGKQAAHYLDHALKGETSWAIAGRNKEKLETLAAELSHPVQVLVADSQNQDQITEAVSQAEVVLTTAGPFDIHGEPLVKACLEYGTHYLDITGETPYVKRLIDKYHKVALECETKIIPFCGFDSVPSDLGVYFLQRETQRRKQSALKKAKGYFSLRGGVNGGTLASVLEMLDQGQLSQLRQPDLLTPPQTSVKGEADIAFAQFDKDLQVWTAPFFMAPVNTRVVRRSAGLYELAEQPYAPGFSYQECMYFNELLPMKTLAMSGALGLMGALSVLGVPSFVRNALPSPGTGPSEKQRESGFFKNWVVGYTESGEQVKAYVFDKGDPGNDITVKILCEAAMALVFDTDSLPGHYAGGVLTPAVALGDALIDRLEDQGMVFDWRS